LSKKLNESIECALPHKCSKEKSPNNKCAQCEIDYNFIAFEPQSLKCGHHVCIECTEKIKNGSFKCKICSNEMTNLNAASISSDCLIDLSLKQLTDKLYEKYKFALSKFTGKLNIFCTFCINSNSAIIRQ
jgi:hypothetical protein